MAVVQVQRCPRIIHRRVLAFLHYRYQDTQSGKVEVEPLSTGAPKRSGQGKQIHRSEQVVTHLDGQAQVLNRQVPQRSRPCSPPRRRRPHQRRETRRVADQLVRVAQQKRLHHQSSGFSLQAIKKVFAPSSQSASQPASQGTEVALLALCVPID